MAFVSSTQEWQSSPSPSSSTTSSMSILSTTSAPQPSKAVPERKPKLRASCDACAASKVKCSKQHPICARCAANGSQCIYGVSRKHGKPGRTRKRNPDGTPFIKASKQRPSPDGREFGKFRIRPEPLVRDSSPSSINTSSWPSTPEWRATPEFDFNNMTPETSYSDPDFCFMDDMLLVTPQPTENLMQTMQPELSFRDPFQKKDSLELDFSLPPEFQALKSFVGGETVNPLDYGLSGATADSYFPNVTPPESPKGSNPYSSSLGANISMPASHCCYALAYSTLETLQFPTPEYTESQPAEQRSLDLILCITKTAVQNVTQLLSCQCAADPHLAMLYSSIVSRIITWYQIAAGLKPNTSNPPSTPALSILSSSPSAASFSDFSSPLSTPSSTSSSFNIKLQPLKIGQFEFDEADQEAFRRTVVQRELKKCGGLVEAIANWSSGASSEQAEFLYDILGAWLKSELYKTVRDISGGEDSMECN